MTQSILGQLADINASVIEQLISNTSPTTSILLPPTRPGDSIGDKLQQLRSLAHGLDLSAVASLLEDLEPVGGPGLAIFASTSGLLAYRAPVLQPRLSTGPNPLILPLLSTTAAINDLFVLSLSRKHVRLVRVTSGRPYELPLPAAVLNLLDQMAEHNGTTLLGVPNYRTELFFARLDSTLSSALPAPLPVILMGVHEEIAAFRRVSRHLNLLSQEIPFCGQHATLGDIAQAAGGCAQKSQHLLAAVALTSINEHADRAEVSSQPAAILEAALAARVLKVCLDTPAPNHGLVQPPEQLLNDIAVEVLRHGGEVFILPPSDSLLPGGVVAQFRF